LYFNDYNPKGEIIMVDGTIIFKDDGTVVVPVWALSQKKQKKLVEHPEDIPENVLMGLIKDVDPYWLDKPPQESEQCTLLWLLASNEKTPINVLNHILEKYGETSWVIEGFIKNAPEEILWKIWERIETRNLPDLVSNKNTPLKMLQDIFSATNHWMIPREIQGCAQKAKELILIHPNSSVELIQEVFKDYSFRVDYDDEEGRVIKQKKYRAGVVSSMVQAPSTPREILVELVNERLVNLALLALHPNCDSELIRQMYERAGGLRVFEAIIAAHPKTPKQILEEISKDDDVIGQIAKNSIKIRKGK
jgi:hypothetical protein